MPGCARRHRRQLPGAPERQARRRAQAGRLRRRARRAGRTGAGGRAAGSGRGGAAAARRCNADRANWDAPYIISPHSPRRLYWASNYVYRSDDRGDSWTRISPDLTAQPEWEEMPIMGKVWPADSVAYNESTTALSNVVSLDESPLLEGLIYVGTDDGLLQVTEDGGKNWRKVEDFPGVPKWTYVSDVFASPRDANTVFVALNNWQRGDYKPYLVKSTDRGRTWTNIAGNLPDRHDVWSVIQDHVNGNLMFAGTEFGLFTSVDGGAQLGAAQGRHADHPGARHGRAEARERSRARHVRPRVLRARRLQRRCARSRRRRSREDARLFPLRDAYLFSPIGLAPAGTAGIGAMAGNWTSPNPPFGAVLTYNVKQALPADAKLVLTIADDNGRQVRGWNSTRSQGSAEWRGTCAAIPLRRPPTRRKAGGAASVEASAAAAVRPRSTRRARPLPRHARQTGRRHGDAARLSTVLLGGADTAVT